MLHLWEKTPNPGSRRRGPGSIPTPAQDSGCRAPVIKDPLASGGVRCMASGAQHPDSMPEIKAVPGSERCYGEGTGEKRQASGQVPIAPELQLILQFLKV